MRTTVTKYPTIRNLMSQLKPIIGKDFILHVTYSGSNDSGWFDQIFLRNEDGSDMGMSAPDNATRLIASLEREVFEELGNTLERRFPGWEIGDGHVMGSCGYFTISSKERTIAQHHEVLFESSQDESPDEVEHF
jgi:hypothetical protein